MRQPSFWYWKNPVLKILYPIGWIYGFLTFLRIKFKKSIPAPNVICVGNLSVGGVGKTPVSLYLSTLFNKPVFLNHGYKSQVQNVIAHHQDGLSDEALELSHYAPTVVNSNRRDGYVLAQTLNPEKIIMDDGFQNPDLDCGKRILVFDGRLGIGNGMCLPVGPLREPLRQGLNRANAVVIIGDDETGLVRQIHKTHPHMPIFFGDIHMVAKIKHRQAIAFAGIGRPEKFFNMLKKAGIGLNMTFAFPDHHQYTEKEIAFMCQFKQPLLTTRKDFVKIPPQFQSLITVVDIKFIPRKKEEIERFFK